MTVYYLFQQIQILKQENTKEITDLFETYLEEVKMENKRLEDLLSDKEPQSNLEYNNRPSVVNITKPVNKPNLVEHNKTILQTEAINDQFETSLEAQILQLYNQGIEAEEIAKKLNCGKTEAALVINLYKKKS
jgi:hypothetical protein